MLITVINEKELAFDLVRANNVVAKVMVGVRGRNGYVDHWSPLFGINTMGEVWRYPNLPADLGIKLNKEGKILEIK